MVWRLNNLNMIQRPWETGQPVAQPSPSHHRWSCAVVACLVHLWHLWDLWPCPGRQTSMNPTPCYPLNCLGQTNMPGPTRSTRVFPGLTVPCSKLLFRPRFWHILTFSNTLITWCGLSLVEVFWPCQDSGPSFGRSRLIHVDSNP